MCNYWLYVGTVKKATFGGELHHTVQVMQGVIGIPEVSHTQPEFCLARPCLLQGLQGLVLRADWEVDRSKRMTWIVEDDVA